MTTEQDWLDALTRPLIVLTYVLETVGVVAIVMALFLILARSPKDPRK